MKKIYSLLVVIVVATSGFSQASSNISLLYHWKDSTITQTTQHSNAFNEIWGYAKEGREYAIIGSTRGVHIFDVTNPASSQMVDFVWGRDTGRQIVHRDYHDYKGYLYAVSDEGDASLQIMDMSYLPDSVHLVYDEDSLFVRSHNIFIDTATDKLYSCGGENKFDVYDLSNPLSPVLLKRCHIDIPWWASTVGASAGGYVHDVYVRNDTAWCNAGDGLFVVDFTNMSNPVLLGSITTYPDKGYNHSGWLSEDGKTYAQADETHGKKVKILDVTNIGNIQFLDTVGSDIEARSIPHNLIFRDNYLFVSYYFDGVYIWDLTNPSNPVLTGFFDTSNEPNFNNYRGNWGVYPFLPSGILLASDMQEGLFVLDVGAATSIKKENKEDSFKVFPNPINDNINVMGLQHFGENYNYELIDLSGKVHARGSFKNDFLTIQNIEVPTSMTSGTYILTISNKTFKKGFRLIKS